MPIYAYRCTTCGNAQDMLRKISDPPLTVCPACGAPTFVKQVTAAGFQLKGSGWYVTDFRDGDKKAKSGDGAVKSDKVTTADAPASSGEGTKSSDTATASAAPSPAPAPAAAPSPAPAPAPAAKPAKGET